MRVADHHAPSDLFQKLLFSWLGCWMNFFHDDEIYILIFGYLLDLISGCIVMSEELPGIFSIERLHYIVDDAWVGIGHIYCFLVI